MKLRKSIAVVVTAAVLGVGGLALAPAAGAQTTDPGGHKQQVCERAHDAWQRLVAANQRAVDEYHRLRAKQQELLANHHYVAAHRLGAVLDRARRRHEAIKDKVLKIAARVKRYCTESPPTLAEL